jgi:hypothetical protein
MLKQHHEARLSVELTWMVQPLSGQGPSGLFGFDFRDGRVRLRGLCQGSIDHNEAVRHGCSIHVVPHSATRLTKDQELQFGWQRSRACSVMRA